MAYDLARPIITIFFFLSFQVYNANVLQFERLDTNHETEMKEK